MTPLIFFKSKVTTSFINTTTFCLVLQWEVYTCRDNNVKLTDYSDEKSEQLQRVLAHFKSSLIKHFKLTVYRFQFHHFVHFLCHPELRSGTKQTDTNTSECHETFTEEGWSLKRAWNPPAPHWKLLSVSKLVIMIYKSVTKQCEKIFSQFFYHHHLHQLVWY